MLSLFNRSKNNQAQQQAQQDVENGSSIVVVSHNAAMTTQTKQSIELPGLKQALIQAQKGLSCPTISPHTAVTAITAAGNLATEFLSFSDSHDQSDHCGLSERATKAAVVVSSFNIILSEGFQISEYVQEQRRIQQLQKDFLGAINHLLTSCFFIDENSNRIDLQAPFTVERIMPFLYVHGVANFTLNVDGAEFTLQDNSFTSKTGKVLAAAVGANALFAALNISHRLGALIFSSDPSINNAFRMGTSVASNVPLVDAAGALLKWSKCQNRNLLEAIVKVINVVYLDSNSLHKLPSPLIDTLDWYINKADMGAIRSMRDAALELARDPELALTPARTRPAITG